MRILAIESSANTASVAIIDEECLVAEYTINHKKTHSQTLLPMIDEICNMTESDCKDLDAVAVSVGPGSFTGLRIGAATGKGIALALNKKMVAVPTLEAMAYNYYGADFMICPIMDAKRRHLYAGVYTFDNDNKLVKMLDQTLISYEDLVEKLNAFSKENNKKIVFVGDGIDVAKDYFKDNLSCEYEYAFVGLRTQRAASVALAARCMVTEDEGKLIDGALLCPDYLRPSQAERLRNA